MTDYFDQIADPNAAPQQKSAALRALQATPGPRSWLPDEAVSGAGIGAIVGGALLPFSKTARRLGEKVFQKPLAEFRKANPGVNIGYPYSPKNLETVFANSHEVIAAREGVKKLLGDAFEATIKAQENKKSGAWGATKAVAKGLWETGRKNIVPTTNEGRNLANYLATGAVGAAAGTGLGAGIGYAADKRPNSALETGDLDKASYKYMLDVLTDPAAPLADRQAAQKALYAQGVNTNVGLSTIGQSIALGSLGMLAGGLVGQKLGKRIGWKSKADAELGNLTDMVLGEGARKYRRFRPRRAEDLGEGIGDAIGLTAGGALPFAFNDPPKSFDAALKDLNSDDPVIQGMAKQRLMQGYDKTKPHGTIPEALLGSLVGLVGGAPGGHLTTKALGGYKKTAGNFIKGNAPTGEQVQNWLNDLVAHSPKTETLRTKWPNLVKEYRP